MSEEKNIIDKIGEILKPVVIILIFLGIPYFLITDNAKNKKNQEKDFIDYVCKNLEVVLKNGENIEVVSVEDRCHNRLSEFQNINATEKGLGLSGDIKDFLVWQEGNKVELKK
jgi:preprotein translocase subunit YajC